LQRLPPVGVARHALADYFEAAIGTVTGAGQYGACTRYSGRRTSTARLVPRH
jgi:hypothetical protein